MTPSVSRKTVLLMTSAAPEQTPFSTTEKRPPLGIGFLISVLRRAGHKVLFVDNYLNPTPVLESSYLMENNVDVVGIYVNTICFRDSLRMLYRLEYLRTVKKWQGIIVVGGPHTTVCPETIPDFVDFVVQGEGEQAMVDIVEEKVAERIVRHPSRIDLNTLPSPAWDCFVNLPYNWGGEFFDKKPVFSMNTSRGCPFNCTFCSVCSIWGKQYTSFSPERVVEDIRYLMTTHNAQGIYFREDNFTLNRNRLREFCNLLLQKNISIPWACESRVNTLDRELVKLMAASGACGFYFGVESGSQRMLDFYHKDITVEQIHDAFQWCHEFNIKAAASVIVGAPTETSKEQEETQLLIQRIKPSITWHNVFTGIPRSPLYEYCIDNNLYEFKDDRGLVYLRGHNERVRKYYGNQWDARVPVSCSADGLVENPKVSVIMSVHNGSAYLAQALSSVAKQSLQNFEMIIVDDASTDDTRKIIDDFKDPRMRVITNEENRGLTKSLNTALQHARGCYVARMDADDISLPHRFEIEARFLDTHPRHAVIGSSFYVIDESGKRVSYVAVLTDDGQIRMGLKNQNWFCHGSVMMRRSALEVVGGYDEQYQYAQDYDLWFRLARRFQLGNWPEPLYCRRQTDECITVQKKELQQECAGKIQAANAGWDMTQECNAVVTAGGGLEPRVSVIIPTYNRPDMLVAAIRSALNQSFTSKEIIVVNDRGMDVSGIVSGFNDSNTITYVCHSVNRGLGAARNTGIRIARGEYLVYLDDDDLLYPTHLETLYNYLASSDDSVAYTDSYQALQVNENGVNVTKRRVVLYSFDFDYDRILYENFIPVLCIMHKKSCLEKAGYFDETLDTHEDWDLWIRMSRAFSFHHINQVTCEFSYRSDGSQMTSSRHNSFVETTERIYEKNRDMVRDRPDIQQKQQQTLAVRRNRLDRISDPEFSDISRFMEDVIRLVEQGQMEKAVATYLANRSRFKSFNPQLIKFDALMKSASDKIRGN